MIGNPQRARQRGSALLIVLVFAAIVAIMLYREMPVVMFEAERQKEALLMDRGNEYVRGVKLYVRKFQTFPPSMEALENTNRMRFLRMRYVDPYTGKDDWRILHAGPNGIILDSKIKSTQTGPNGTPGSNSSSVGQPSSVTNPFANSFVGGNPPPSAQQPTGFNIPQRGPAMPNNPGASGGSSDIMAGMPQDAQQQIDPQAVAAAMQNQAAQNQAGQNPSIPYPGYPGPPTNGNSTQTGGSYPSQATGSGFPSAPGRFQGTPNPTGDSYPPGQSGSIPPTLGQQDPQGAMQSLLNTQNPTTIQNGNGNTNSSASGTSAFGSNTNAAGNSSGLGRMGAASGGTAIAGVASKSPGRTIKILNDQSDRSLWEFVYDMQKEAQANAPGLGNSSNGAGNNTNGINNGTQNGQSSSSPSAFGQSGNLSNPITNPSSSNQPAQTQNQ